MLDAWPLSYATPVPPADRVAACATGSGGWRRPRPTRVTPADYLDMFRPLRAGADLRARVVEVRPETADAVTVVLRPGGAWRGHRPGQYVRIGVDVDGVRLWRSYSLTSAPGAADGLHHDHRARRSPDGLVSAHLAQELRPGQLVQLDQALGDFVLPDPAPAQGPVRHRRQRHHPGDGHAARRPGPAGRRRARALRGSAPTT